MIGNHTAVVSHLLPHTAMTTTVSGALVDVSALTGKFDVIFSSVAVPTGAGAVDVTVNTCSGSGATETTVATFTRHSSGAPAPIQKIAVDSRDCSQYLIVYATVSGSGVATGSVVSHGYSALS